MARPTSPANPANPSPLSSPLSSTLAPTQSSTQDTLTRGTSRSTLSLFELSDPESARWCDHSANEVVSVLTHDAPLPGFRVLWSEGHGDGKVKVKRRLQRRRKSRPVIPLSRYVSSTGELLIQQFLRERATHYRLSVIRRTGRGIDLERRGHEVARIFYSKFGAQVAREGIDAEDLLQDIYKGIIARNRGRNPYNPAKASFSHYVFQVIRSVFLNYRKKHFKRRTREQLGMYGISGGEYGNWDVTDTLEGLREDPRIAGPWGNHTGWDQLERLEYAEDLDEVSRLLVEGYNRKEISQITGISPRDLRYHIEGIKNQLG